MGWTGVCSIWLADIDRLNDLSKFMIVYCLFVCLYQWIFLSVCLFFYLFHYNASICLSMYLSIYSPSFASTYLCLRVCCRHVQEPPGEPLAGSSVGSLGCSKAWGGGEARQGPLLRQQDLNAVLIDVGKLSAKIAMCLSTIKEHPEEDMRRNKESRPRFRDLFFFRSRRFNFVFALL